MIISRQILNFLARYAWIGLGSFEGLVPLGFQRTSRGGGLKLVGGFEAMANYLAQAIL